VSIATRVNSLMDGSFRSTLTAEPWHKPDAAGAVHPNGKASVARIRVA
jgi:hypothetical protein